MSDVYACELARKLNVKRGMTVRVLGKPADVDLQELSISQVAGADGVLLFARTLAELEATAQPLLEAAAADHLAWLAYPKAGQLGTDLNRDIIWRHLLERGVQGVRQIALDGVWSAMRFRPVKEER
ncbi:MAG TPA: hypothetical protein VFL93_11855 [Longimicrobiaceae bacterium]|nr:hypothetical protein [Longimicrobiaceae bacterium]